MRQNTKNVLLMRDDVGRARATTRDLPGSNHTFGLTVPKDNFNVCHLTSYQIEAEKQKLKEATKPRVYDKNFLSLNKIATRRLISTSKG